MRLGAGRQDRAQRDARRRREARASEIERRGAAELHEPAVVVAGLVVARVDLDAAAGAHQGPAGIEVTGFGVVPLLGVPIVLGVLGVLGVRHLAVDRASHVRRPRAVDGVRPPGEGQHAQKEGGEDAAKTIGGHPAPIGSAAGLAVKSRLRAGRSSCIPRPSR